MKCNDHCRILAAAEATMLYDTASVLSGCCPVYCGGQTTTYNKSFNATRKMSENDKIK